MVKFRLPNENDKFLLQEWIASDKDHADRCDASFWLPDEKETGRVQQFVVEDEHGALAYVRAENCLRMHVQFAPRSQTERTRNNFDEVMEKIYQWARPKYKQVIFESVSTLLIRFLQKRGFRKSPNEFVKDI